MCLAVAFHLRYLHQRLPAQALTGVGNRDRIAIGTFVGKHESATQVAVVGNGQRLPIRVLLVVGEEAPESLRVLAVESGERCDLVGTRGVIAQYDNPVQVVAIGHGRPFKADEGTEDTGLVGFIGHARIGFPG